MGLNESATLVRDALLLHPRPSLSVARSYWDLCPLSLQHHGEFQVAVLDVSTSAGELRRSAEYIRRRWPDTAILLIADIAGVLDDPLYDHRVPSSIEPCELLSVLDGLKRRERAVGQSASQRQYQRL